ncbi:molybdopterin-guanine dinucleotide biosynthesis protein B [Candidatus Omnitrophota bacterium]
MKKTPFIFSIVGKSDSGKTTLILKLLPELKGKGYKVAVAKHCPHGFDLDIEGKDSWRFTQAGSEGTFLSSDDGEALIRQKVNAVSLQQKIQNYFSDFDIVLMEGYNYESGIEKMQIIRKEIGGLDVPSDGLIAYISDTALATDKPIFNPDDISGIISFVENRLSGE